MFKFCLQDAGFHIVTQLLQFLQSLAGTAGEDALLDGIEHILDSPFGVGQLTAEQGQGVVLGILQGHQFVCDLGNEVILEHPLDGVHHGDMLDPVFLHGLFVAALPSLGCSTLVIAVDGAVAPFPAFSDHHPAAVPTEQLGRQQVFFFSLCPGGSPLVLFHSFLHPFKQFFRDDGGDCIRNYYVLVPVFANVLSVFQQTIKAVHAKFMALSGQQMALVEVLDDFPHCFAVCVSLENLPHHRCSQRVDSQAVVFP